MIFAVMFLIVSQVYGSASGIYAADLTDTQASSVSTVDASDAITDTATSSTQDDANIGSVTFQYPVEGVEFSLYLVGEGDGTGTYVLHEPFSSYDVNITSSDAAATLALYVELDSDSNHPLQSVKSDKDGNVTFENLEKGVYLITGDTIVSDGYTYIASPVLLELPIFETTEGNNKEEVWDLVIESKYEKSNGTGDKLKAVKVWKNDTESSRPSSVTVQLLCNGKVSDRTDAEVTLDKSNDWTYTWTELSEDDQWTVVEKSVPTGYTVSISKDGSSAVITNTKEGSASKSSSSGSLPQTGQLWWPVSVLTACGLLMILIGLILRRKHS